jgi:alcohol dehydrogenase YqhD (iron-dependent ADH family)
MKNTITNMRRLLKNPDDMQARGNLMWDSAMAENGILKAGHKTDFQVHQLEHQVAVYTDINHGQGLAVILPAYYRHIINDGKEKLTRMAKEVFGKESAEEGIDAIEDFIKECSLPTRFSQLKSTEPITEEILRKAADTARIMPDSPRPLSRDEFYEILISRI